MQRIERILGIDASVRPLASGWRIATGLTVALALAAVGIVHAASDDDDGLASDPAVQALQEAVKAGEMSIEEARQAYFQNVYPGSDTQAKIEGWYEDIAAKIDAAVAEGELSQEDAGGKMDWVNRRVAFHAEVAFAMEVRGLSYARARLDVGTAWANEAVANGEATEEEVAERIARLEREVALEEEIAGYVDGAAAKLDAMVETGELSQEQADAKLEAVREQITQKVRIRVHLEETWAELQEAVAIGEISQEDAEAKMTEVKQGIAAKVEAGRRKQAEAYLERAAAKIDAMVESGEMSAEDGEAKMIALEQQFAAKAEASEQSKSVEYLKQVAVKIEAMVASGEMSAEDGEAKLIAIQQEITLKAQAFDQAQSEAYLEKAAAELDAKVKRGELSAEDAEAKMMAMRDAVGAKARAGSLGSADAERSLASVEQTLQYAVQKGEMSKEEAERMAVEMQSLLRDGQIERLESMSPQMLIETLRARTNTDVRLVLRAAKQLSLNKEQTERLGELQKEAEREFKKLSKRISGGRAEDEEAADESSGQSNDAMADGLKQYRETSTAVFRRPKMLELGGRMRAQILQMLAPAQEQEFQRRLARLEEERRQSTDRDGRTAKDRR